MEKRVGAILVCAFLALAGSSVFVPKVWEQNFRQRLLATTTPQGWRAGVVTVGSDWHVANQPRSWRDWTWIWDNWTTNPSFEHH